MITTRKARPWLFAVLFVLGVCALAVELAARGKPVAEWLVRHGVRGIWGRAAVLLMVVVAFMLILEASLRLAYLGARVPRRHGTAKAVAFGFGVTVLIIAWMIAASFLAPLLRPHVGPGLGEWLETVLLLLGALAIGVAADRIAPRFGINLKGTNRNESQAV